jgi:hypothetical protein
MNQFAYEETLYVAKIQHTKWLSNEIEKSYRDLAVNLSMLKAYKYVGDDGEVNGIIDRSQITCENLKDYIKELKQQLNLLQVASQEAEEEQ